MKSSNHSHLELHLFAKLLSALVFLGIFQQCNTMHNEKYWLRVLGDGKIRADNFRRRDTLTSQPSLPPGLEYVDPHHIMSTRSFQPHLFHYKQTKPWDKIYKHRMALWHDQLDTHVPSLSNDLFMRQIYDGECETNVCREFNSDDGGFSMAKFSKFSCKCPEGKMCKTSFRSGRMQGLCMSDPGNSSDLHEEIEREQLFPRTVFSE